MPNWCWNFIEIKGESEPIQKLTDKINDAIQKKSETLMQDLLEIEISEEDWYDERINNFGCKWDFNADPYIFNFIGENEITISIESAWSPPINFLEKLCKKYNVSATIFYEEGGNDFAGKADVSPDGITDECYPFLEGLYRIDRESFWNEAQSCVEYAFDCYDEKPTWESFKKEFTFLDESSLKELEELFNSELNQQSDDDE